MAAQRNQDVAYVVESVEKMNTLLRQMLERAKQMKETSDIEPAITNSDLGELLPEFESFAAEDPRRIRPFTVIDTTVRDIFNELLASSSIDEPSFVQIWNLLDVVSILADQGRCDPALTFHLIEELLDSQTVAGCRKIFDYLESRQERLVAKESPSKSLVILRSCNELKRRLSRAEDTAFCGRVFIFLFQSFPLGDKSSVNLRGEYHTENETIFDELPSSSAATQDAMQVDTEEPASQNGKKDTPTAASTPKPIDDSKPVKASPLSKGVTFDAKTSSPAEKPKDPDTLYPIFWSLQRSFNQPKKLFEPNHFASFKSGLEDTMVMFKSVPNTGSATTPKAQPQKSNSEPQVKKRKLSSSNDDLASAFNPKYLTSRDLFELEISDLSFRRHILVQALIVLDFLLSLSPKAKEKLASITPQNKTVMNKSVMYSEHAISEEDTKWALDMKRQISEYLRVALEGAFFLRMVETVLARDKNWLRWKMESCPSIQRPAVSPQEVISAKQAVKKAAANKRLRPQPMSSMDLSFLTDTKGGLERLKNPDRWRLPTLASFERGIADDDFNISMEEDEGKKQELREAKASKTWRALRIASKTKLSLFDKIEDTSDIRKIFEDDSMSRPEDSTDRDAAAVGEDSMEVDNGIETVQEDAVAAEEHPMEVENTNETAQEAAAAKEEDSMEVENTNETAQEAAAAKEEDSMEVDNTNDTFNLSDRRPVFIHSKKYGPARSVIKILLANFPQLFDSVQPHKIREKTNTGIDSSSVDDTAKQFATMRDSGEFLVTYNATINTSNRGPMWNFGISKKAIDTIIAEGKVPVILCTGDLAPNTLQNLKSNAMPMRFIRFIHGKSEDRSKGLYDEAIIFSNYVLRQSCTEFENFMFGREKEDESPFPVVRARGGDLSSLLDELEREIEESDMEDETEDVQMLNAVPEDAGKVPPPVAELKVETDAK